MDQQKKRAFKNHLYEQFARIGKALSSAHRLELLEELGQRLIERDVILLDVRPVEEYEASHLPGALSMPVTDLEARLPELPRGKEIVAYCRGPYCVFADEAVTLLQTNGYNARRLEQGLPDWRALALPVESGTGAHP